MNALNTDTPAPQTISTKPATWQRMLGIFVPFLAGVLTWSAVDHASNQATIWAILTAVSAAFLLLVAWWWSGE